MAHEDKDLERMKELIEIMKENDLVEVEIKHGDDKIFLKRCQPQSVQSQVTAVPMIGPNMAAALAGAAATEPPAAKAKPQEDSLVEIKSPIVGTFYSQPSPDSEPYVEIGSPVDPQMVICMIEAMKVMNEIKAETSGTIAEILVTNGQAVEYGQVLFKVKPD